MPNIALTPDERAGGMMEPGKAPDVARLVSGLRSFQQALGPSIGARARERSDRQRTEFAAGNRGPTPMAMEDMELADSIGGVFMGSIKAVGGAKKLAEGLRAYHGKFTSEQAPANFRTVVADVDKLDEAWRVGSDWIGEGSEIGNRRAQFRDWMKVNPKTKIRTSEIGGLRPELVRDASGSPIQLPDGTFKVVQVPSFSDGRHRFSVLRDSGAKELPISVSEEIADEFAKLFGTDAP